MTKPRSEGSEIDEQLLKEVRDGLRANRPIRRRLAGSGELRIERQLPFAFIYRRPPGRADAGTASLLRGEAAYLIAPEDADQSRGTQALIQTLYETIHELFGAVLLAEVWTPSLAPGATDLVEVPRFRVVCPPEFEDCSTTHKLVTALRRVTVSNQPAQVSVDVAARVAPPDRVPILSETRGTADHLHLVGIEVHPIHQDPESGDELPITRRLLHAQLARALREAAFEFSRRETQFRPRHFQALGRHALKKVVWNADRELAAISRQFDLLLMVTPVNTQEAFREFEAGGYDRVPEFFYRRRTIDPPLLKRALYRIPIDKIDDPTLGFLLEEKRRELGLKITLVEERETPRFLPVGIALFGHIDADLLAVAKSILGQPRQNAEESSDPPLDARAFAARAEALLARWRDAKVSSRIEIQDDLTSLTVSNGNLLVGSGMTFQANRVEALLQHEIGTHVVTHWNGRAQPFELLEVGLAGYDALQEGLAVFAEFLVGGLTHARLRTLGVRVVAAHMRSEGAGFVETFRELRDRHGFSPRTAFLNTLRIFRGGGLVKDGVYLRGLRSVLEYVAQGGELEQLLLGKVSTDHVPILLELKRRRILKPLRIRPPYLDDPACRARLERARKGLRIQDILVAQDEATRNG